MKLGVYIDGSERKGTEHKQITIILPCIFTE